MRFRLRFQELKLQLKIIDSIDISGVTETERAFS
jgi:hypothetical protein